MSNPVIQRLVSTDSGWAPLALRVPVGVIFMAHGAQKLFGWFGGYGVDGTGQFMASLGLEPGVLMAILAVHFEHGLFLSNNGYEYGLALFAASVALMLSGAGRVSVDAFLASELAEERRAKLSALPKAA